MAGLEMLMQAILHFLTPGSLFTVAWSTMLGFAVGMLPGLTATMGVALLVSITYGMGSEQAIMTLICVYLGAIYGGSRTAILINIPGTPASACSTLDGHPLTLQGRGGLAMGIATTASTLGTFVGILALALITPFLSEAALSFGSYEFFWLALFGVAISGQMSGTDTPLKGYIAGILGLLVAMVGMEGLHAYQRFTFGIPSLGAGIDIIPAMVGAFGLSEIFASVKHRREAIETTVKDRIIPRFGEVFRHWRTIIRSGLIGTGVGIIPGVGEDIGAWTSYAAAKRASKHPEEYGRGSQEGLIAAETGNNAVVPASMIPTLTLALPGSAAAAVLIAAMFLHGVRPGPLLLVENPGFFYQIVAMLLLATIANLILGLSLSKAFMRVMTIPSERLMAVIAILCVVGSFAVTQRMFEVYVMVAFGFIGFLLRELRFPMAPLVLGIVLGELLDVNLRRGLGLTRGDPTPFFTRPISAVFFVVLLLIVILSIPAVNRWLKAGIGRVLRRKAEET